MNISDLTYLLNKPEATNEKQTIALENVVLQYPYFQAARALHLKGLFNQESFRYNYELKKTAAHTTDRSVLFDFITSDDFKIFQQEVYDKYQAEIQNLNSQLEKFVKENEEVAKNLKTFDTLDFVVYSNQEWKRLHESHAEDILVHYPDGHTSKGIDLAKERIALFQSDNSNPIVISSSQNEGTTVILKLQIL